MREFAMSVQDLAMFVSLDDKHRIKVGKPNYPIAAAERGRQVLVGPNEMFEVGDHDFTNFSIIPSVSFMIKIPETNDDSWYDGGNNLWRNPVERIMNVINLGLQCVGLMRKEGSSDFEKAIKNENNSNAVCEASRLSHRDGVRSSFNPLCSF